MASFNLKNEKILEYCLQAIKSSLGKVVTINEPKRSRDANAYYWTILEHIGQHTGDSKDDLHFNLKWAIFGPQYRDYKGQTVATVKESRDLSKEDFSKLIDAAQMLAIQLNVTLPAPKDLGW